uniref:Uncharacterized protein n=1 Tax=Muribaculaceae bacterium Z82 TaxID=2304548 RepID=A0A7C9JDA4_9BACT
MAIKKPAVRPPKTRAPEDIPQTLMGNNADLEAPKARKKPGPKPKDGEPMVTISLTLPASVKDMVLEEAERQDRSVSSIVRMAIKRYFSEEAPK